MGHKMQRNTRKTELAGPKREKQLKKLFLIIIEKSSSCKKFKY